jgi:hypothetical protein
VVPRAYLGQLTRLSSSCRTISPRPPSLRTYRVRVLLDMDSHQIRNVLNPGRVECSVCHGGAVTLADGSPLAVAPSSVPDVDLTHPLSGSWSGAPDSPFRCRRCGPVSAIALVEKGSVRSFVVEVVDGGIRGYGVDFQAEGDSWLECCGDGDTVTMADGSPIVVVGEWPSD